VENKISRFKGIVTELQTNIFNVGPEQWLTDVSNTVLNTIGDFNAKVINSVEGYGKCKGKAGRDLAEREIKNINNRLEALSKAVSLCKQVHEFQQKFIEDPSAEGTGAVENAYDAAFKQFLKSYEQRIDLQDSRLNLARKCAEYLNEESEKQDGLYRKICKRSVNVDSNEMMKKITNHDNFLLEHPYSQYHNLDQMDIHTIVEIFSMKKEFNKDLAKDLFEQTEIKIQKRLNQDLPDISEENKSKVKEFTKNASERYEKCEGRVEQVIEIIDQLIRLDKNLEDWIKTGTFGFTRRALIAHKE
jgi:hypothetical protein